MKSSIKIKGKSAYFSHSMYTYNTEAEKLAYKYISSVFTGKIICPNNDIGALSTFTDYAMIASRADVLFVFTNDNSDIISKGCFREVLQSLKNSKKVYYVVSIPNDFQLFEVKDVVKISECSHNHGELIF